MLYWWLFGIRHHNFFNLRWHLCGNCSKNCSLWAVVKVLTRTLLTFSIGCPHNAYDIRLGTNLIKFNCVCLIISYFDHTLLVCDLGRLNSFSSFSAGIVIHLYLILIFDLSNDWHRSIFYRHYLILGWLRLLNFFIRLLLYIIIVFGDLALLRRWRGLLHFLLSFFSTCTFNNLAHDLWASSTEGKIAFTTFLTHHIILLNNWCRLRFFEMLLI